LKGVVRSQNVNRSQRVLTFTDKDGLKLDLVEDGVEGGLAVRGLHSVCVECCDFEKIERFWGERFGLSPAETEVGRLLFTLFGKKVEGNQYLEFHETDREPARLGYGSVHHVALAVAEGEGTAKWREGVKASGFLRREYWDSCYFYSPCGALFELATEHPGLSTDLRARGTKQSLSLPPHLEDRRAEIEKALPNWKEEVLP
jgi:glyoxalase family protein